MSFDVRTLREEDRPWIVTLLGEHWSSHLVISRGRLHDASVLPGLVLAQLHSDAVAEARRSKPEIPLVAHNGIPIRDELELEMKLAHTS
jgi:hypothetical protein